jgi:RNA polymerase sigma factor (sigma-70 family)
MAAEAGTVLNHIHRLSIARGQKDLSDDQLLRRFSAHRDEEAFAALVQRHGRLVWDVCRRVLGDAHDAEDAFQATFLVLSARAGAIRKTEALASWLHGVAYRVALRAKRDAGIRRVHERRGQTMTRDQSFPEEALREALALLDEEVEQLPARQRAVFVLCYLDGKTLAEAARELGWKEGAQGLSADPLRPPGPLPRRPNPGCGIPFRATGHRPLGCGHGSKTQRVRGRQRDIPLPGLLPGQQNPCFRGYLRHRPSLGGCNRRGALFLFRTPGRRPVARLLSRRAKTCLRGRGYGWDCLGHCPATPETR